MTVLVEGARTSDRAFADFVGIDQRTAQDFLDTCASRESSTGEYRLSFVGIASLGGRPFVFLPKILATSKELSLDAVFTGFLVRVLRRYGATLDWNDPDIHWLRLTRNWEQAGQLLLADFLLKDYLGHGLYLRSRHLYEVGDRGSIDWARTVANRAPLFSGGRPLYYETVVRTKETDTGNTASWLHAVAILEAAERLSGLLGYKIQQSELPNIGRVSGLTSESEIQSTLRRELRQAFDDRSMQLLQALLAWFGAKVRGRRTFSLFGTNSFHRVWESVCQFLLRDESSHWREHIPRPLWEHTSGAKEHAAETFIPDIIRMTTVAGSKGLLIADAKYYKMTLPPGMHGQPGVNDVAKQLWYAAALKSVAEKRGAKIIYNVFLVPTNVTPSQQNVASSIFAHAGYVRMDAISAGSVAVFFVDAMSALGRYVDGLEAADAEVVALCLET